MVKLPVVINAVTVGIHKNIDSVPQHPTGPGVVQVIYFIDYLAAVDNSLDAEISRSASGEMPETSHS